MDWSEFGVERVQGWSEFRERVSSGREFRGEFRGGERHCVY